METLEIRNARALERYREEWTALLAVSEHDFFQTPEWHGAWLAAFWPDRPLAYLLVRHHGELVGLAPLLHDTRGELGCAGLLALPVNPHTPRSNLICAVSSEELLEAVTTYLRQHSWQFRLGLQRVPSTSSTLIALHRLAERRRVHYVTRDGCTSAIVQIAGDWASYLGTRSPHFAHELRRKQRKLERVHRAELIVVTSADACAQAMDHIMQIERRSGKESNGSSFSAQPAIWAFYRQLARRCAERGWLRLYLLYLDGRPAAHIFGVEYRHEYYALKTSFDGQFRLDSPGHVLFTRALEDAFARQLRTFDFLGSEASWQSGFATGTRAHTDICAFSPSAISCRLCVSWKTICTYRLRPLAERHAPQLLTLKHGLQRSLRARGGLHPQERDS